MKLLNREDLIEARRLLLFAEEKLKWVKDVITSVDEEFQQVLIGKKNQLFGLTYNNLGVLEKL